MPAVLFSPGFPVTNGGGQEGLGKGIDTATGFSVTPSGIVATPAAIRVLVEAALAGNGPTPILGLYRPPNQF
jgi:hypothetical protein